MANDTRPPSTGLTRQLNRRSAATCNVINIDLANPHRRSKGKRRMLMHRIAALVRNTSRRVVSHHGPDTLWTEGSRTAKGNHSIQIVMGPFRADKQGSHGPDIKTKRPLRIKMKTSPVRPSLPIVNPFSFPNRAVPPGSRTPPTRARNRNRQCIPNT